MQPRTLKDIASKNVTWIISIIMAVGATMAVLKQQALALDENIARTTAIANKVNQLEISLIKLDGMREDILDIKSEIRDIKRIILRPVISKGAINPSNTLYSPNLSRTNLIDEITSLYLPINHLRLD